MSDVRFPSLRAGVRTVLAKFADPEFQRRVWLERIGHEHHQDIDEDLMQLYDDAQVLPDPQSAVGEVLYPAEVAPMRTLDAALTRVLDDLADDAPETDYLAHPEWQRVIEAARAVLDVWQSDDV